MILFAKEKIERLEIDLTGSCNARCPLCARNYKHLNVVYNERHLNEITKQLDEFINLKYIHLVGAMSEPTLYKQFFSLCHYLIKRNIVIEVCTNGDTHTPDWWAKLGEILTEKDSVYFSVCGSTQELHEIYRVGCSLENLLENARAFRKANKYGIDYVQHIEFEYNKEDIKSPRMQEIFAEFSNINMTLTYFTRDKGIYKNPFNLDKLLVSDDYLKKYDAVLKYTQNKWDKRFERKVELDCYSINTKSIHIDQFGKIYPCYIWLEESRVDEWNGDYQEIIDFKHECCKNCEKNAVRMLNEWGCELL